jgi:hypothetical protein
VVVAGRFIPKACLRENHFGFVSAVEQFDRDGNGCSRRTIDRRSKPQRSKTLRCLETAISETGKPAAIAPAVRSPFDDLPPSRVHSAAKTAFSVR